MTTNLKDKLVTLESLSIVYSEEQDTREAADLALSTRIDNIVAPEGDSSLSEVADARVSGSTTYANLKARLDADKASIGEEVDEIKADLVDLQEGGYIAEAQQIQTKINTWLTEHPEATTTVQDGSLTEAKFSNALKLATIKDYVTPEMFGAKGDGVTDDYDAISAAISAASTRDVALAMYSESGYFTATPVVIEDAIDVYMIGALIYKGGGTALTIGKAGSGNSYEQRHLYINVTSTQENYISDSVGVRLINMLNCDISLFSVFGFETNVVLCGDGYAFSYNSIKLGRICDSLVGMLIQPQNSGWVNENTFYGGRFFCYSTASYKNIYTAISIDGTSSSCNNNTFIDPCFEGANVGVYINKGQYNRFLNVRAEATATVLKTTTEADNYNVVTVGFGNTTKSGLCATSAVIAPQTAAYDDMICVFNSGNLADYCVSNASWMYVGKQLCGLNSSYAQTQSYAGKRYTNYITLTLPLGVLVDTSEVKRFTADIGALNSGDARICVIMFDENGKVINSGVVSNNSFPFSARTMGGIEYQQAGANCLGKRPIFELPDTCKQAFIGVISALMLTQFKVYANGFCPVIPTTLAKGLGSVPTCAAVAGDFCPAQNPSGGTIGWVCTGGSNWTAVQN